MKPTKARIKLNSRLLPALIGALVIMQLTFPYKGWQILLIGLGGGWLFMDGWRLRQLTPAVAVETLYVRLYGYGVRLAIPLKSGDTPYEFVDSLVNYIDTLAQEKRWQRILTPVKPETEWLTKLYIKTAYSQHAPTVADQRQAIQTWQRLRQRLWLAKIKVLNSGIIHH